jgi:hypothetical protein
MSTIPDTPADRTGLGAASLALGCVGLCFFFLPVMGIPVSAVGLLLGLIGLAAGRGRTGRGQRLAVSGTLLCLAALALDSALALIQTDLFFYGELFPWLRQ